VDRILPMIYSRTFARNMRLLTRYLTAVNRGPAARAE